MIFDPINDTDIYFFIFKKNIHSRIVSVCLPPSRTEPGGAEIQNVRVDEPEPGQREKRKEPVSVSDDVSL